MIRRRVWKARFGSFAVLAGVVALMQVAADTGFVSTFLMPSPAQIAASYPRLIGQEDLLPRLLLTAIEVFAAASLAVVVGGLIGWGLSRNRIAWLAFNGWITGLNAAPLIMLFPLFLVVFGRGAATIMVLGVLGAFPPIALKTHEAFATVRPVLLDVGRSFNLGSARQFWLIQLPAAAPTMVAGVRLGCFYALISVIGAEFLTGVGGLGALIPDLAERYQLAAMYGTIVFVILTSAMFIAGIKRIERWLRPI
jgi:ABC-type nitrate/sulfonate/bicarbonate transport system permease component